MDVSSAPLISRQVAAQHYLEPWGKSEQLMTGTVIASLPGLPENGRRISFRILHVFELRKA